jgi:flavin-dependent dehydrogenase
LAAAGLDVVLVEAQSRIGEGAICSGVIGEEAFRRFDLPTHPVLTSIRCIQAISPGGKKLEYQTEPPLARVVDKKSFNRALGERALTAGAGIELNRRVESIEREKHAVILRLRAPSGEGCLLQARVAVIASGVNGSLNRNLNLARPRQFLRAMQTEVTLSAEDGQVPTRVQVGQSIAPGAFAWEIPLGRGRVRVGVMTTHDPRPYFQALLRRLSPTLDPSRVNPGQKGIAQASVGCCVRDRLLAVGEAAGHVKTSTGGGIYYGLLSAEFAVQALVRAFQKGDLTAQTLAEFERYWRTAFGNELLVGYFARELASRFPDSMIDRIFEVAHSRNLLVRLNGRLKFDWHQKALLTTIRNLMFHPGGIGHD